MEGQEEGLMEGQVEGGAETNRGTPLLAFYKRHVEIVYNIILYIEI